ncbi:Alcohol dehydrogenase superfamily zinc-containing [Neofusicoccum parvum]|uniref:Alcohol dehydrogenase superfamily zinc-containing n=1 Tax=Neofusicoccum parvum TaxID=310453 RepID=A0ACB5SIV6_9PEZI|nr:Alcohol dehydrogenase superfamily zinc-containing [Neofusicoccum parvum]GME49516.1 Alcohol dehydrogenase superfamily zinc-containing [Neofusicoccum parvum]
MPTSLASGPFLSLRHDPDCGRQNEPSALNGHSTTDSYHSSASPAPFSSLRTGRPTSSLSSLSHSTLPTHVANHANHANGTNGTQQYTVDDDFLKLGAPQQDVLLLHGPRQKYSLEKAKEIPSLKSDDEILIQVLAIGLNPVDWKGPDYNFGQPSYPWVNGRDFAGLVVRAPRKPSRIQSGDVVFGPSTDYRDIRKAAYQEYVVTTDYNVARIPKGVSVKTGAAIGVAFVAAVIGLGTSLGVDFSSLAREAPLGPDLYQLVRSVDRSHFPDDVREEVFESIPYDERPTRGEWIVIWGGSSTTGIFALQLAKLAGLRVIAVADVAKNGKRLIDFGADMLVDRFDHARAIDVIRSITGNQLRFAIDVTGQESATHLQEVLHTSAAEKRAHLLGFTGLPKTKVIDVQQHAVPIKIFHTASVVGESVMTWLEELLVARTLQFPDVEVADGGLAGINAALDKLRSGTVSGKRIVVPIEVAASSPTIPDGVGATAGDLPSDDLAYADQLNSDPDRIQFAYWVPNVSGGLVISKIPQRTKWDLKSNKKYAQTAERVGFEYALSQIRFMAGYGADNQHEPVTFSQALLHSTERLKLIAALLPGPWNPAVAAKQIASIDHYTEGRVAVNIVSGWFKAEFTSIGQWWLDHAERYRRSREFIECLRGIWTQDAFTYRGDFYQFHDYPLKPKPLSWPGRPHPEIFQGGNSLDARENAGAVSDVYFMNGNTLDGFLTQIADVRERAARHGRDGRVRFALNGFVIVRDTEAEAVRVLQEIQGKADADAVEGFRQQVQNAGASTSAKTGMWAQSSFEDLVQYNDGFKTKLIGTKEQVADRILLLKSIGVDILLTAFLHYDEEIQQFGETVLPLVRQLEKQGRGRDKDFEIALTGDVYRERKY